MYPSELSEVMCYLKNFEFYSHFIKLSFCIICAFHFDLRFYVFFSDWGIISSCWNSSEDALRTGFS